MYVNHRENYPPQRAPYGVRVARIRTAFTLFESVVEPLQLSNLELILVQSSPTPYSHVLFTGSRAIFKS